MNHQAVRIAAILAFSMPVMAQLSTATINGTIRDGTGSVIPGATVVVENLATSVRRATTTNETGRYLVLSLQPGRYSIEATAAGFQTGKIPSVLLEVNQTATLDFALQLGSVQEQVTVEAVGSSVQASTAELGSVVLQKQVVDLPLNGRNFTQLLTLMPGASPVSVSQNRSGFGSTAIGEFTYPSINGQSNRSNFFLMDGINNHGAFVSTYAVPPIVDAIQEFKVQSHNDQAEFGMATGGTVNVVTKSGTNEFHGALWEFLRNDALDARNTFRRDVLPLRQNMFGATLGGPVIRNKTFFFAGYQGFRNRTPQNNLYRVPTDANYRGDLSDWPLQIFDPASTRVNPAVQGQLIRNPFPNNQIPASRIDQGFLKFAQTVLPKPIQTGVADRNALDLTNVAQNQEEFTARIDHNLGEKDIFWARGSGQLLSRSGSGAIQSLANFEDWNTVNIAGSWVHTFGPSSILQVQVGRVLVEQTTGNTFRNVSESFATEVGFDPAFCCSFRSGNRLTPNVQVTQFWSGGETQSYNRASDVYQYKGNYTRIMGNHQFKAGGEYNDLAFSTVNNDHNVGFNTPQTADPQNLGRTGSPLASMFLNVPITAARRDFFKNTRPGGVLGFFVQDTWKATSRLTINIGLRYDRTYIPPVGFRDDRTIFMGDMDLIRGKYILQAVPGPCSQLGSAPCIPTPDGRLEEHIIVDPREKLLHDFTDNWQPRLGIAYRLTSRTAIRSSFGLFYDSWAGVTQSTQNLGHTWPDVGRRLQNNLNSATAAEPLPTISAKSPFPTGILPEPSPFETGAFFLDPFFQNAKSVQWNFGIQHQVQADTLVSINYVGSANTRLPVGGFFNVAATPGPGNPRDRRPFPYINPAQFDKSWGRANYNALQTQVRKRFSNGFSITANYTWSKNISIASDGFFGVEGRSIRNPYDINAERSVAGTDLTHMFNVNWTYAVPIGRGRTVDTGSNVLNYVLGNWQINGILTLNTGQPYTVNMNGDIANTGNQNGYMRPDIVGNPRLENASPARWIDTSAFARPAAFTFGSAGRNILRADGNNNIDLSLFRIFPLPFREGMAIEFRAEAFNAFNSPMYSEPVSNFSDTRFGTVISTANQARQFQLGLKLLF